MTPDLTGPLETALEWRAAGRDVAIATVLETWGSAPRRAGAHMVVSADGSFAGSVSGGCVEAAVVEESARVIRSGRPTTVEYGITNDDAWAVGLACGGTVRLRIEPVDGSVRTSMLQALVEARRAQRPVVLATRLSDGAQALLDPAAADGGMAILHGEVADWPWTRASDLLAADRTRVVASGELGEVLLRPYAPAPRIVVIGGAHVAQPLVEATRLLGFVPIVVDPRTTFASPERFPDVRILTSWPEEALDALDIDLRTAVVALSHDPKLDDPALIAALRSPAFYVGVLGSRRTHAARVERLREAGVDPDAIAQLHAPVGLDIGAVSPAEIALSVAAQVVSVLRRGSVR